jgi:hypothetical protein
MPSTNSSSPGSAELGPGRLEFVDITIFETESQALSFSSEESDHTTFDTLFIGCRVCVRGKQQRRGQIVRLIPMTGRVIVRLDPPYPTRRGTLRSFCPKRLVIS